MRANIVFAGGGVKGAVFVGCYQAAVDLGVKPQGFGGTSAGSIIATLAAVGFTADELEEIVLDKSFVELLDDGGKLLNSCRGYADWAVNKSWLRGATRTYSAYWLYRTFSRSVGLYEGKLLREYLSHLINKKIRISGKRPSEVTFSDLDESESPRSLRVVATDILNNRAVVFGTGSDSLQVPIIDAVFASSCFPFVFKPIWIGEQLLSDGGLSSNLPSFLFSREYDQNRIPTLAFDLVSANQAGFGVGAPIELRPFAQSLLSSALSASDVLLRESIPGVSHLPINSPPGIDTLKFDLSREDRDECIAAGLEQATTQLEALPALLSADFAESDLQRQIVGQFAPPHLVSPVLEGLIARMKELFPSVGNDVRAHVMLVTGHGTRILTYSANMETDADRALQIADTAGCSGLAWDESCTAFADLDEARKDPASWGMTDEEHALVPERIKAMLSTSIPGNPRSVSELFRGIGSLSIDCAVDLKKTGWLEVSHDEPKLAAEAVQLLENWALVVSAVLR